MVTPRQVNYNKVVTGVNQPKKKISVSYSQHKFLTNGIILSSIFFEYAKILNISIVEEGDIPKGSAIKYTIEIISHKGYPKRILDIKETKNLKLDISNSQVKIIMESNLVNPIDVTIGLQVEV